MSVDEPEWMERLILAYPQFIPMYEQIYEICGIVVTVQSQAIFQKELCQKLAFVSNSF